MTVANLPHSVLVTGGAGYIGSHCVRRLLDDGFAVVVVDNLYSGNRWAVPESVPFMECSAGDSIQIAEIIRKHRVDAVLHFAGHIVVPESVRDPLKYYANNTCVSRNLIQLCLDGGVGSFIFSSSAAVYGQPRQIPVPESAELAPVNPYGTSKLATEWMLRDVAAASRQSIKPARADVDFRYVALRYFNVAGAHADGTIGQATPQATHLIKVAAQAACGLRPRVSIFGTDYQTRDGTCVRDYIHIDDLIEAHVLALKHLRRGGPSAVFNVGYGEGYTVREVLGAMRDVAGGPLEIVEAQRRSGDAAVLIADSTAIRRDLEWTPRHNDIRFICESAVKWERKLLSMRRREGSDGCRSSQ